MAWRPSDDGTIQRPATNDLWSVLERFYDNAIPTASLPRHHWSHLSKAYVPERRFDSSQQVAAMLPRLPQSFKDLPIGPTEIELIDFLLHYKTERVLNIEGPRGAGKTSLLHYVEAAIRKSGYSHWPVFIIVNCLEEEDRADISRKEFALLVAHSIERDSHHAPDSLKAGLQETARSILSSPDYRTIRNQFASLSQKLPADEFNRIVFALDNLDQMHISTIGKALELAKEIYLASNAACLTALRPGCQFSLFTKGTARAFFRYKLDVAAPRTGAWFRRLGRAIAHKMGASGEESSSIVRCHGTPISKNDVCRVFDRLVELLNSARRDQNSAIEILDSVAADDARHLLLLTRHLLSHRELPSHWLVKGGDMPDFHPIPAILEGSKYLYDAASFVPNLLCCDTAAGTHDFLIFYRILTLLNAGVEPVQTGHLLRQTEILGHGRRATVHALRQLHDALLVRSTNAEFLDSSGPLPDAFFITEAGSYYIHHFLVFGDYFATVIPNVPLNHDAIRSAKESRRRRFGFAERLQSILELSERIRNLEKEQVDQLESRESDFDVIEVAEALENGGLLSRAILLALETLEERAYFSSVRRVKDEVPAIDEEILLLKSFIETEEKRLRRLAARVRGRKISNIGDTRLGKAGTEVVVQQRVKGSQIRVRAEVRSSTQCSFVMVGLFGLVGDSPFAGASIAVPKEGSRGALITREMAIEGGGADSAHDLRAQAITNACFGKERIALLTTARHGGAITDLRLHVLKGDKEAVTSRDIGRVVSAEDLKSVTKDVLCQVASVAVDEKKLREALEVQGSRLSRHVLSSEGENIVGSYRHLLDRVVLFVTDEAVSVPWEWLRISPAKGDSRPELLGQMWSIVRWPADKLEDMIHAMCNLEVLAGDRPIGRMATIGLASDPKSPWRVRTPESLAQLQELASSYDSVHIVGHLPNGSIGSSDGGLEVGEKLTLTPDGVRATLLEGPSNIVLSACGAASGPSARNLAIGISATSGCSVWAPMVDVREDLVEKMDRDLVAHYAEKEESTFEQFFADADRESPFRNLYVRYGVAIGGSDEE